MIEISQKDFEEKVEEVINGNLTRTQLSQLLDTDKRTINNKILELASTNPDLYKRFIEKFPYRPKTINVGSIENLAIYVIENGLENAAQTYGISIRTITRKVNTLKENNPELYKIYGERKSRKISPTELKKFRVSETPRDITKTDEKRYELTLLLTEFDNLIKQGKSKAEAARIMGYDGYPTIWKKANELKRIISEQQITENKETPKNHDNEEPEQ